MRLVASRNGRLELMMIALLVPVMLTACGESTTHPTMQSVVGRYHVVTIDGAPLPWVNTARAGPDTERITSVELELQPGGTMLQTWRSEITGAGGPIDRAVVESGTFTVAGSEVVMTYVTTIESTSPGRASGPATADGLTLTTRDGRVIAYVKEP